VLPYSIISTFFLLVRANVLFYATDNGVFEVFGESAFSQTLLDESRNFSCPTLLYNPGFNILIYSQRNRTVVLENYDHFVDSIETNSDAFAFDASEKAFYFGNSSGIWKLTGTGTNATIVRYLNESVIRIEVVPGGIIYGKPRLGVYLSPILNPYQIVNITNFLGSRLEESLGFYYIASNSVVHKSIRLEVGLETLITTSYNITCLEVDEWKNIYLGGNYNSTNGFIEVYCSDENYSIGHHLTFTTSFLNDCDGYFSEPPDLCNFTNSITTSPSSTTSFQTSSGVSSESDSNSIPTEARLYFLLIPAVLIISALAIISVFFIRRKKRVKFSETKSSVEMPVIEESRLKRSYQGKTQPDIGDLDAKVVQKLEGITYMSKLEGNDGEMYLGNWNGTQVLFKKFSDALQFREFERESGVLSKIRHPNCAVFLGTYTDSEGSNFIVTEYIPTQLKKILRKRRKIISDVELISICADIAKALSYLTSKNILHRNIALRNILVTLKDEDKIEAKVADFGLSREVVGGIYSNSESVTPIKWTAIEVLKGASFTSKSDVWSYGVLLYEIFSLGKEPYEGLSNKEAYKAILEGKKLLKPERCPMEVFSIMEECWLSDPVSRPSFAEILFRLKAIKKKTKKLNSNDDEKKQKETIHESAYDQDKTENSNLERRDINEE